MEIAIAKLVTNKDNNLNLVVFIPKDLEISSPANKALYLGAKIIKKIKVRATNMPKNTFCLFVTFTRVPKFQKTMFANWLSSAKYCNNVVAAANRVDIATPTKMMVVGEKFFILAKSNITPIHIKEDRKANEIVRYGLEELIEVEAPPLMIKIAILAPNTPALLTPNVDGEDKGLFKVVCITSPHTPKAAPHIKAAQARGSLIFCMIKFVDSSPCPNKPIKT